VIQSESFPILKAKTTNGVEVLLTKSYINKLDEIRKRNGEVLILIETFDETYSQDIIHKYSYADEDWLENVKFDANFRPDTNGKLVLHIDELSNVSPV
jgi:hypothetical protein